jgi:non-ribosomal peptide synthetase component F
VTYAELFADKSKIHIGKPIANTRVYILDENLELLPPGAQGKIWLAGLGVSNSGYVNKPEETAKRFLPDSIFDKDNTAKTDAPANSGSDVFGTLMYDSGDIGRYLDDGNIEYLGRADSQVKLRGYRIELSEIEEVLCESALVQTAVVDVRENELFAWCVLNDIGAAGGNSGAAFV